MITSYKYNISEEVTLNKKMSEELGDILKKAVTLDLKKDYYEAIIYYQKGIEILCRNLKRMFNEFF